MGAAESTAAAVLAPCVRCFKFTPPIEDTSSAQYQPVNNPANPSTNAEDFTDDWDEEFDDFDQPPTKGSAGSASTRSSPAPTAVPASRLNDDEKRDDNDTISSIAKLPLSSSLTPQISQPRPSGPRHSASLTHPLSPPPVKEVDFFGELGMQTQYREPIRVAPKKPLMSPTQPSAPLPKADISHYLADDLGDVSVSGWGDEDGLEINRTVKKGVSGKEKKKCGIGMVTAVTDDLDD